jgi:cytochrome c
MARLHSLPAIAVGIVFAFTCGAHANAADDAAHGERVFAKCAPCHAKDSTAHLGPGLQGVVGRQAGSIPGFRYSGAMKNAKIIWDEKTLDAFLAAPQKAVPGTTMPFAGLQDPQERSDLIAYLATLK